MLVKQIQARGKLSEDVRSGKLNVCLASLSIFDEVEKNSENHNPYAVF
jgi:hypothetical protein